ncbi:salicylate carboxymethyltransferase-like isoform X1 [Vitis riparia]|uniref:salicylate carboxymethyltransferase-like isoform X1 n=1 Tax=Vitis riparia TaxID=96939 RepID=UPI00155A49AF|nr:salicylate carboxymethyltransferase-like isoform X1 [Vitis riparia]
MEVVQVLCMKGGNGDTSYAKNSLVQKKVISLTKPIIEDAITNLYCNKFLTSLCIADLGCSSGPNTLFAVLEVVTTVDRVGKKMGRQLPEIQVFLNDLPGNDFNTIFKSLPGFQKDLEKRMGAGAESCFINGVPGSFYCRLFPSKSLHFIHSSYSLQWLSQVPQGLESNKGNIYMASSSPPCVLKVYYEQFRTDFSMFLRCRSEELLEGGSMVLTFLGRRSEDPSSKECCYIWELLAVALNDMVAEGLIEEEKMDSFNIPQYTPSPAEVKCEVEKEGSFTISRLEVSEVNWNAYHGEFCPSDAHKDGGYNVAKLMRAVAEPLLVSHFGDGIIEEVFSRYQKIVADRMSREKTEFVNVTVFMTKRG